MDELRKLFGDKETTDKLRSHPLYQEALQCFRNGNNERGMELLREVQKTDSFDEAFKQFESKSQANDEMIKNAGIVMIDKTEPMPEGYDRNTFTDKTNITLQPKNKPAWNNIEAKITYKDKIVYEDYCSFEFLTMNMLFGFKKDYAEPFYGKIVTSSDAKTTMEKFKKNCLCRIMDHLSIELVNVNYSVREMLEQFGDCKYLKDIVIIHNKEYDDNELKAIKKLFAKTNWITLIIKDRLNLSK